MNFTPTGAVQRTETRKRRAIHDASLAARVRIAEAQRWEDDWDHDAFRPVPRNFVLRFVGFLLIIAVAFAAGMRYGRAMDDTQAADVFAMSGYDIDDAMPKAAAHQATYNECVRGWRVTKGDTLTGIAFSVSTALQDLRVGNPQVEDANKIFPGDHVCYRWKSQ